MDIIQNIIKKQNQVALEFTRREERRIIKNLEADKKITAHGFNTAVETLRPCIIIPMLENAIRQEWQQ